jgi:hypothetical protein
MNKRELLNEVMSYLIDQRIAEEIDKGNIKGGITGDEAFGAMVFSGIVLEKVRKLRDSI